MTSIPDPYPPVRELTVTHPPVAVGSLLVTASAEPDPAAAALLAGLPADEGATLSVRLDLGADLPAGGYTLTYRPDLRELEIVGADSAGQYHGAAALRSLIRSTGGWAGLPGLAIRDWPQVPVRGLLESFYGAVWSPQRRRSMVDLAADLRMNTYGYGPAGDEQTGTDWRTPYPPERLAELADLVSYAAERHIDVVYRVSPSAPLAPHRGIRFADDTELQTLIARFRQVGEVGVRAGTIAFDDVRGVLADPQDLARFGADPHPLAAAHAHVANTVAGALPGWRFLICPTEYWGATDSPYRHRLGQLLDPGIQVWWTGPSIVSRQVTATEAGHACAAYGRERVWLWDNFPVNDFDPHRLHMGPYTGRDPAASAHLDAVLVNCGPVPEPDMLTVAAAAEYAWGGQDRDPYAVQAAAAEAIAGPAAPALLALADLCQTSPLMPREQPALAAGVWRYLAELDAGNGAARLSAAVELRRLLTQAQQTARVVRAEAHLAWLSSPVQPWLTALEQEATVALAAIDFLELWLAGEPGTSDELYAAGRTLRDGFEHLEPAQPRVLWELVRPLAARARPASSVAGLPYRLVATVDVLTPDGPHAVPVATPPNPDQTGMDHIGP